MDGLPNFLTHGAPLVRLARQSSAKILLNATTKMTTLRLFVLRLAVKEQPI